MNKCIEICNMFAAGYSYDANSRRKANFESWSNT